jgi:hypothetical protein
MSRVLCVVALVAVAWPAAAQPLPVPIVNPPPTVTTEVKVARVFIATAMVTSGIDYGVTMYATGRGLEERNPALRWAQHRPIAMGVVKLGAAATTSTVLLKQHRRHPKRTAILAAIITAINTAAIVHNARVLRAHRDRGR